MVTVKGEPIVFRWHCCNATTVPVDDAKAARLVRCGERVSPNPRRIAKIKDRTVTLDRPPAG